MTVAIEVPVNEEPEFETPEKDEQAMIVVKDRFGT